MAVVVLGVNHRTVPLDLFEQMAVDAADLPKALADAGSRSHVNEVVVLSTCNRIEVYAVVERFHESYSALRSFLAEQAYVPPEAIADHLYLHHDEAALSHLFHVVAGIDSVVVGETEILGQVKHAWEAARIEGAAGPLLNAAFRHALEVGKRARTDTAIARHIASASTAAVAMAQDHLGGLEGRSALVVGAGDMGAGIVAALAKGGVSDLRIANRTRARAEALAGRVGGRAVPLLELRQSLAEVDVLLTSTGATALLLDEVDFIPALTERSGKPLLIVDLAVPRDVDPLVGDLPGVTLLDMEDLSAFASKGMDRRRGEIAAVELIIEEELVRFNARAIARGVTPVIAGLHDHAEQLRLEQLARFAGRLDGLNDRQREAVEALTHGIMAKVLHTPTMALKREAGTARGDGLADAICDLFDLDPESR